MKKKLAVLSILVCLLTSCYNKPLATTGGAEEAQSASSSISPKEEQRQSHLSESQRSLSQHAIPDESAQSSNQRDAEPIFTEGEPYRPDNPSGFILYYASGEYFLPLVRPTVDVLTGTDIVQMLRRYNHTPNADMEILVSGNTVQVNFLDGVIQPARTSSIAETLLRGCVRIEHVRFLKANEPYRQKGITDDNGFYIPVDFQMPPLSPEQVTALRAQVPYYLSLRTVNPDMTFRLLKGEEVEKLTEFLYSVHWYNRPTESFDSIEHAPPPFLLAAAINNAGKYCWEQRESDPTPYSAMLEPLGTWGSYNTEGYLKEHVDKTARYFFGDSVSLNPEAVPYMRTYNEYAGIYVDNGFEYYVETTPVILEYQRKDAIYEMIVVHLFSEIASGQWCDNKGNPLDDAMVAAYCLEEAERYKVCVEQQPDGSFHYLACQLLDK